MNSLACGRNCHNFLCNSIHLLIFANRLRPSPFQFAVCGTNFQSFQAFYILAFFRGVSSFITCRSSIGELKCLQRRGQYNMILILMPQLLIMQHDRYNSIALIDSQLSFYEKFKSSSCVWNMNWIYLANLDLFILTPFISKPFSPFIFHCECWQFATKYLALSTRKHITKLSCFTIAPLSSCELTLRKITNNSTLKEAGSQRLFTFTKCFWAKRIVTKRMC